MCALPKLFEIIEIADDASGSYEPMGTKPKFWFFHIVGERLYQYLYKETRHGTGEDWSEKIASELCALIGLPHARYELATFRGKRGVASEQFIAVPESIRTILEQAAYFEEWTLDETAIYDVPQVSLVHGNELLLELVQGYERAPARKYRVSEHTIDRVLNTIENSQLNLPLGWTPPIGITSVGEVFTGYLLLDAWIGNTDRHHENWGVVEWHQAPTDAAQSRRQTMRYLAPTYDHASSLGCHITDEERIARLKTADRGFSVEAYAQKARSALYGNEGDAKPMSPIEAFARAAARYPQGERVWLDRLAGITGQEVDTLFERLPRERMTESASLFARRMLHYNRGRLLDSGDQI